MNRPSKIFWVGLLIYFVSFSLRAVGDSISDPNGLRGINCAWVALALPLNDLHHWMLGGPQPVFSLFESLCLLVSGLINPLFVVTLIFGLDRRYDRLASQLRIAVVLIIPFCWVFFSLDHQLPLAGHFVWVAGILVTMFSEKISEFRF